MANKGSASSFSEEEEEKRLPGEIGKMEEATFVRLLKGRGEACASTTACPIRDSIANEHRKKKERKADG